MYQGYCCWVLYPPTMAEPLTPQSCNEALLDIVGDVRETVRKRRELVRATIRQVVMDQTESHWKEKNSFDPIRYGPIRIHPDDKLYFTCFDINAVISDTPRKGPVMLDKEIKDGRLYITIRIRGSYDIDYSRTKKMRTVVAPE